MSSISVRHFELPCIERCYINKLALSCLALTGLPKDFLQTTTAALYMEWQLFGMFDTMWMLW